MLDKARFLACALILGGCGGDGTTPDAAVAGRDAGTADAPGDDADRDAAGVDPIDATAPDAMTLPHDVCGGPGGTSIVLADFNGASLPLNHAGATYPNHYDGEGGHAVAALDTSSGVCMGR